MPRRPDTSPTRVCPDCQHRLVSATTRSGQPLTLDVEVDTYRVILNADNKTYRAEMASGYPRHQCTGRKEAP